MTHSTSFKPGLAAVSSLGFGGANAHVIIKPYPGRLEKEIPQVNRRLVFVSGRTPEAIDHFLDKVQKHQKHSEFLALVDEIHKINVSGHIYRG